MRKRLGVGRRYRIYSGSSPHKLPLGFERQLRAIDPKLEIIWDNGVGRWQIYRCARPGVVRSSDRLVHVLEVSRPRCRSYVPPGEWILEELKRMDPARRFPEAGDPEEIHERQEKSIDSANEAGLEKEESDMREKDWYAIREAGRYARDRGRGRKSYTFRDPAKQR